MREFINKTASDLTFEQHEAVIKAARILSEAFQRRIYAVTLNPHANDATVIWGVAFAFNMSEITRK